MLTAVADIRIVPISFHTAADVIL